MGINIKNRIIENLLKQKVKTMVERKVISQDPYE